MDEPRKTLADPDADPLERIAAALECLAEDTRKISTYVQATYNERRRGKW